MIDAEELVGTVFSGLSWLVVEGVEDAGDTIVVRAGTRDKPVACPCCGEETSRVHGYHGRTAADVPVDGRRVLVPVRVRRMRCPVLDCPRQNPRPFAWTKTAEEILNSLAEYLSKISGAAH